MLKSVQMEEVRKQIKFRDVKRNEINDYWEKNNKLIEKSYDDLNKTNNHDLFKDYKQLNEKLSSSSKLNGKDAENYKESKINFGKQPGATGLKVTEFAKMARDLSKIQLEKNIIAKEQEMEKKFVKSRSVYIGRNLFNEKKY